MLIGTMKVEKEETSENEKSEEDNDEEEDINNFRCKNHLINSIYSKVAIHGKGLFYHKTGELV